MKSLLFKNLLLLTTIFSLVFLFSCGDEDPEEPLAAPTVSVTASKTTYTVDDTIAFDVTYSTPGEFGGFNYEWTSTDGTTEVEFEKEFLTATDVGQDVTSTSGTFTFKPFGNTKIGELDLTVNSEAYSLEGKDISFSFEIANKDDTQTGTDDVDFDVEVAISVYEQLLFGAQGNAEPGFYGVTQNTLYNYGNARDNSADVDFAYYWGETNESTIAAIDDSGLNAVYSSLNNPLPIEGIFATRNSTRFVRTDLNVEAYSAVNTSSELETEAFFEVGGTSSIPELVVDDILAFQLSEARGEAFGLIRIISINDTNGNGTITIEVKAPASAE